MPNLVEVTYAQTGESTKINPLGMREMQARAYRVCGSQYILLKAPPASGKSRALMFIGLDKLYKQGIKKVVVSVPEMSIGASFGTTDLIKHGFWANWEPAPEYNLCTPSGDAGKVKAFERFFESDANILICTHATLRKAFESMADPSKFNNTLLAIDEFHHVSADETSRLGKLLRDVMAGSNAHIVAMTGSYFRGDNNAVLSAKDEAKFTRVTYNYYEQLNGYTHLKSLGIGYHFYQGRYCDSAQEGKPSALMEALDTDKKTILHIPNVQSGESTKEKHQEVGKIIDQIGTIDFQDQETGVLHVKRHTDDKIIKIADLVDDSSKGRERITNYLRSIQTPEDLDLIIALGMAKEGFDWPFCEHALTVGYRGSLTEVIQIIGRCTRDSENKTHAQFTNLIAQPDADDPVVKVAVNNMLKAITCSLLMEQVLAPNFKFRRKVLDDTDKLQAGEISIKGFKEPSSKRVTEIIESDLTDLKATILQDNQVINALPSNIEPEVINKIMIPKVIREKYPDLNEDEVEQLRQYVVVDSVIKTSEIKESDSGDMRFVRMAGRFVNIEDLDIDLIDSVNPFQKAFSILSKSITTRTLRVIQESVEAGRFDGTMEEAVLLFRKAQAFEKEKGHPPNLNASDPYEKRMAKALAYIKEQVRSSGVKNG